jgi:hypothetical protein
MRMFVQERRSHCNPCLARLASATCTVLLASGACPNSITYTKSGTTISLYCKSCSQNTPELQIPLIQFIAKLWAMSQRNYVQCCIASSYSSLYRGYEITPCRALRTHSLTVSPHDRMGNGAPAFDVTVTSRSFGVCRGLKLTSSTNVKVPMAATT